MAKNKKGIPTIGIIIKSSGERVRSTRLRPNARISSRRMAVCTVRTNKSLILKVDRCDEESYRQLIRAYTAEGRRSEALLVLPQCQRVLGEELGVLLMPETQKLFQMLLNDTDSLTAKRK